MDRIIDLIGIDPTSAIVGGLAGVIALLIAKLPVLIHGYITKTPTKLDDKIEAKVKELLKKK